MTDTLLAVRSPATRMHVEFSTSDPQRARDVLGATYGIDIQLSGLNGGKPLTMSRDRLGPVWLGRLHSPGRLRWQTASLDRLVIAQPVAGWHERQAVGMRDRLGPGDVAVLAPPEVPSRGVSDDLRNRTVSIDLALLGEVAANDPYRSACAARDFRDYRPLPEAKARRWLQIVEFADQVVAAAGGDSPLICGQAARFVAAVALTLFPNSTTVDGSAADRTDAKPLTLRRAITFIEAHAGEDITVGQIASAAHVTVRAVQLAFQHHLGTTPLHYLRRIRLERAHHDLCMVDPSRGATVTEIAMRWGFFSPGRFSAQYRRVYGEAPSETLRS